MTAALCLSHMIGSTLLPDRSRPAEVRQWPLSVSARSPVFYAMFEHEMTESKRVSGTKFLFPHLCSTGFVVTVSVLTVVVIVVISVEPCLTNKGEHTALYKISQNVYIKTSKNNNCIVIILYCPHNTHTHTYTHIHTHTHTYTHTHTHRGAQFEITSSGTVCRGEFLMQFWRHGRLNVNVTDVKRKQITLL